MTSWRLFQLIARENYVCKLEEKQHTLYYYIRVALHLTFGRNALFCKRTCTVSNKFCNKLKRVHVACKYLIIVSMSENAHFRIMGEINLLSSPNPSSRAELSCYCSLLTTGIHVGATSWIAYPIHLSFLVGTIWHITCVGALMTQME